ncbi:MAG: DUF5668 domain-containing protein [Bacillota bacterium]|nr:DUF5668 domain-containing protein [Bacillota bacterium]
MSTRRWIGIFLLVIGAGYLLDALSLWHFGAVARTYWPSLLVLIGLVQLATRSASWPWSLAWIAVGLYLQAQRLDLVGLDLGRLFWPAVAIVAGAWLLAGHRGWPRRAASSLDTVDQVSLFGGSETPVVSQAFQGGSVTAIFGGSTLDLRDARLAPGGAELDLTAVFGRVRLLVPESWKVVTSGVEIFGGWQDKTRTTGFREGEASALRVRCLPVFGSIEIRN